MHIGLIAQGGAGWAGGSEYIRNLAHAICGADGNARVTLFCSEAQRAEWDAHAALFATIRGVPHRKNTGFLSRFSAPNRAFLEAVRASGIEFLYPFTYDNHYNLGLKFPLGAIPCKWAGWIPDFQHRHLPALFTEKEIARRDRGIHQLVDEAPAVVLSSESAAADFREFCPAHAKSARVLTFATFPQTDWYEPFTSEDLRWLPERFFVACNQFWAHKNHATIFRALEQLAARNIRPIVICTGALVDFRQPDYADGILQQIHRGGIGAQVMILGLVPRRLQIELIRRSLAVIQPSKFEGWSTVVEDARVLGKVTLLSEIAVHKEQNPPGARFFQADDTSALAILLEDGWATLPAGPDPIHEAAARRRADARIVEVGRRFLNTACQ